MTVADPVKTDLADCSSSLLFFHVCPDRRRATKGQASKGITPMLRLAIAVAIAAPLLSGCIIISTDKPTTRVVTAPAAEASQ